MPRKTNQQIKEDRERAIEEHNDHKATIFSAGHETTGPYINYGYGEGDIV